jgi:cysteine desulfurase
MKVYFDNAATTIIRKEVIDVMVGSMESNYGNPSSSHGFGRTAKSAVETARKSVARHLNCEAQEIIFTSGGTESDNMILQCVVKDLGVKTIISSRIEHHAVLNALSSLESEGIEILYVDLDFKGSPDLIHLEKLLKVTDSRKLVSLMHVNNEIGNILSLKQVADLCKLSNAYFHTDAVQGVGHFPIDLKEISLDFLSSAAHKFHGPKGIGFSFIRKNSGLHSFIFGGPQEQGLRAGTEGVHNIIGLQKAIEIAYKELTSEKAYILGLKKYFIQEITKVFPSAHFNGLSGDFDQSTFTLINVALPLDASKAKLLDFHLDIKGIACSKGSACQSGSNLGSHVLQELNRREEVISWPSLRFSFSCYNKREEIDYVVKTLAAFINN